MKLKNFKTMWGFQGDFETACIEAKEAGFDGIEGPAPQEKKELQYWKECLEKYELLFIAELVTGGDYVPKRKHSIEEHLDDIQKAMKNSLELKPLFITCIAGCDAWSEEDSIVFFKKAIEIAKQEGAIISFETHRSRSLFTPWVTERIVKAIPNIELTLDISHWCVVAERLMSTEMSTIETIAPNVRHVHARVGYAQGPQVPHPRAPEYKEELESHQECWELVWSEHKTKNMKLTTMTPEFGPDRYLHTLPFTDMPIANLWEINCWMAQIQRSHFAEFSK